MVAAANTLAIAKQWSVSFLDEINNAASLQSMLKNGSAEIKREDLRPPHPPQGPGN